MLCVCLLAADLAGCRSEVVSESLPDPYVSPFDWEQLVLDADGHFTYFEDGEVRSRFGIDVSEHQHDIDWQAVAADGVEFAMIRLGNRGATEGALYLDDCFEANYEGALQAGILVGIYFFSQAINAEEARAEAQFVLTHLEGRRLDYPIAFDHEHVGANGRTYGLTGKEITLCARAFCEVIEAAGYDTMLYGNRRDLFRLDIGFLDHYDLWYAEYDAYYPALEHDFVIWQYTSHGSVAGISTRVDLDIHFLP